jgi:hypothetical protein
VLEQNTLYEEILPCTTSLSDRNGKVEFSNLTEGVYLITGEEWNNGSYAFTPKAALVEFSGEEVEITNNYLTRDRTLPGQAITKEVVSIWNDDGSKDLRPQFVTVSLFCDGTLYDQAILNEDNNWRHTWTHLTSASCWQLSGGEAPESYFVELTDEDNEFVLLYNTTEKEGEDESEAIRLAVNDTQPVEREETSHLTVQLWWPVPLLAVCGVILFCFGVKLYRKQMEYDEEER